MQNQNAEQNGPFIIIDRKDEFLNKSEDFDKGYRIDLLNSNKVMKIQLNPLSRYLCFAVLFFIGEFTLLSMTLVLADYYFGLQRAPSEISKFSFVILMFVYCFKYLKWFENYLVNNGVSDRANEFLLDFMASVKPVSANADIDEMGAVRRCPPESHRIKPDVWEDNIFANGEDARRLD